MKSQIRYVLLMLSMAITYNVYAKQISYNGLIFDLDVAHNKAVVVGVNDTVKCVTIPSTISWDGIGYNVTSIQLYAEGSSMEYIIIPSSVTSINSELPNSLKSVRFEDGKEYLGISEKTFSKCEAITYIYIGRNIQGNNLFDCPLLESLEIGNNVTRLGNIISNVRFKNFNIPSNIQYLDCSFSDCHFDNFIFDYSDEDIKTGCRTEFYPTGGWVHGLKSKPLLTADIDTLTICRNILFTNITPFDSHFKKVKIAKNVQFLGSSAFQLCAIDSLSIEYSSDTLNLKSYALSCRRISSLHLNRILSDSTVFSYEYLLRNVTIGDSIYNIPNEAFKGCTNLNYLSIGRNVNQIGINAFESCHHIDTVISYQPIPPIIYSNTFQSYHSVLIVPNGTLETYKNADYWNRFYEIKEIDTTSDSTTGITDIITDKNVNNNDVVIVYNLNGVKLPINRRYQLSSLPHGIYIVNGVKQSL